MDVSTCLIPAFDCVFARVEWRFPECSPCRGAHAEVVPHLTVGARIDRLRLVAGRAAPDSWRSVAEFGLPS